ncbi:uracil-DNA glycosylase [Alicyclobacillus sp. SO9]|uniref:uracil-DNA glycosylase n=1 Tax=Alicyclobacillus sp. SO9 TaxID=2665646 RepID=UPI0018E8B40F|nr:uracil-DNA glycosylase [Alicyclobacillus sp. SO9]QQE77318.1 uracil-DNA glycosylase [Alicyclobacillus sp. SO9]
MDSIDTFIADLAGRPSSDMVNNMYYGNSPGVHIRRENLRLYLKTLDTATVLLVGEAPGHLGCAQTGIPFTSEWIMAEGGGRHNLFGNHGSYHLASPTPKPFKEATATIVWRTLNNCGSLPVMWNAFPWHPHQSKDPNSNRAPTAAELEEGSNMLLKLIGLFQSLTTVVAVGRQAERAIHKHAKDRLAKFSIDHVRHPSHGGAKEFATGLHELLA